MNQQGCVQTQPEYRKIYYNKKQHILGIIEKYPNTERAPKKLRAKSGDWTGVTLTWGLSNWIQSSSSS